MFFDSVPVGGMRCAKKNFNCCSDADVRSIHFAGNAYPLSYMVTSNMKSVWN